ESEADVSEHRAIAELPPHSRQLDGVGEFAASRPAIGGPLLEFELAHPANVAPVVRSAVFSQRAGADSQERQTALSQGLEALAVSAVQQPRRRPHGLAQGAVVRLPPEVARDPGLPGDE